MTTSAPHSASADTVWIASQAELSYLLDALQKAPWIAIDTESNSMFAYRERVCLIQINAGGDIFLLDPLPMGPPPEPGQPSGALEPLRRFLEDPSKIKFIHGGEYDVATLSRDFDIFLSPIFDSQQAAQMLGWEKTGYGALAERICGVKLPKDQAQYNWGTRPIDGRALAYAEDDVRYLPKICMAMREEIEKADLTEELDIALKAVEAMRWHGGFSPDGLWKIKDVRRLTDSQLHMLFALYCLRDELARQANHPAGQLINERVLLAMALHPPKTIQDLKKSGLRAATAALRGQRILEVVRNPDKIPGGYSFPEEHRHVPPCDAERKCEARLREWRQREAARRKVPLQVILPSAALLWLKSHGAEDLDSAPQLGKKRISLYGDAIKKICRRE